MAEWEGEAPGRMTRGAKRHRRTFGRIIPWLDARQQSQPPFHPARRRYRKRAEEARASNSKQELPVRKAGKSVAKEWPFFVQRMGSTLQSPCRFAESISSPSF